MSSHEHKEQDLGMGATTLPRAHRHNCACHITAPCSACFDCKHWEEPDCDNDCQECDVDHSTREQAVNFEYTDIEGGTVSLGAGGRRGTVTVINTRGSIRAAVFITPADVPTVALELLKAAGYADLAGYIVSAKAAREAAEKAEAEAAEKKLQERRDALMGDLFAGLEYTEADDHAQGAVNHIIELEDKLAAK